MIILNVKIVVGVTIVSAHRGTWLQSRQMFRNISSVQQGHFADELHIKFSQQLV